MDDSTERTYNILVYGIEKKGLTAPKDEIRGRNYKLAFHQLDTNSRFNEFDGVILFQGIFEKIEQRNNGFNSYIIGDCDIDELDNREKELQLLLGKNGFVCFILCESFVETDGRGHPLYKHFYLVKRYTNIQGFYRENFHRRLTQVHSKVDEFRRFLDIYGAAGSYFRYDTSYNDIVHIIAESNNRPVGLRFFNDTFFIPSLIPQDIPNKIEDYFKLLASSITSLLNKLIYDIPAWVDNFRFEEEVSIIRRKQEIIEEDQQIDRRLELFQSFKRILLPTGAPLVEAVVKVLREGFGLNIDENDELKEDAKILDYDNKPIILVEIKGTNGSVTRQNVYQAESHRERANLPSDFPSILIINTDIKNSRNLVEKDHPIADEQIKLAKTLNVLIIRTIDLLNLLRLLMKKSISRDEIIRIMKEESGWLRVSDERWQILPSE